jgi:hypothetical protein
MKSSISILCALLVLSTNPATAIAAPDNGSTISQQSTPALKYKIISGYKQPFNDDLQLHLSKGWTPVGGVAVTTWNNDLFFAQLLSRPANP